MRLALTAALSILCTMSGAALADEDLASPSRRPGPVAPLGEAHFDGTEPVTLRFGDLVVSVTRAPDETDQSGTDHLPQAAISWGGKAVLAMRLEEVVSEEPGATVSIIQLDRSSPAPQVMFSGFSGGAHCCTMTEFATLVGGAWHVVDGEALDGDEGYGIQDIDGDGSPELTSLDQSFLAAFSSYAESWAPVKISKLEGTSLVDVTRLPRYQSLPRQDLQRMQQAAQSDPALWRSNGFLAGWVAAKALVGEFDDAWGRMLKLYDRSADPVASECTVEKRNGKCPKGKTRQVTFPQALRQLLTSNGYLGKARNRPASPAEHSDSGPAIRSAPRPS